jgi:hypothetical protein
VAGFERFDLLLPEWRGDGELHLYVFVQDEEGHCSVTVYGAADFSSANCANSLGQGVGDEEDGAGDEDKVLGVGGGAGGGDGLLDSVESRAVDAHLMSGGGEVSHG